MRISLIVVTIATWLAGCKLRPAEAPADDTANLQAIVATFNQNNIDINKPVHIIVIGYSDGLGTNLIQSAVTRANRYRAMDPSAQILFLAKPEVDNRTDDRTAMERFGIRVIEADNEALTGQRLHDEMRQYPHIASFDFFGHSTPWGINTSDPESRWSTKNNPDFTSLRANFTKDAYATLNGCNAGLLLASVLARDWGIPVSGALTGSNFERLWSNGHWYTASDDGHPGEGSWATRNAVSYPTPQDCSTSGGSCFRMRPQNSPYSGYWSGKDGTSFGTGLGFYKTFCFLDVAECERRMAISLFAFPSVKPLTASSSQVDYETVLLDFLCPHDPDGSQRRQCASGIRASLEARTLDFDAFAQRAVNCSLQSCNARLVLNEQKSASLGRDVYRIELTDGARSRSIAREYVHYLRGFHRMNNQPVPAALEGLDLGLASAPPPQAACHACAISSVATVLKKRPLQSSDPQLGTDEKCTLASNKMLEIAAKEPAAGQHLRLRLQKENPSCPGFLDPVYVFAPHFNFYE